MPGFTAQNAADPGADEIRAALDHMAASEAFRGSPQLIAFLRYVVEATLRGEQDRIKGYTIALEALGRGDDFDPQSDPIVRVEATRLRRAIARYYDNGGKHDPVQIELPLGSYVPAFRRGPVPQPLAALPLRQLATERRPFDWSAAGWRSLSAGLALVALGAGTYAALDFWFDFNTPRPHELLLLPAHLLSSPSPPRGSVYPLVYVGAFQAAGKSGAVRPPSDELRDKLRDALARFDAIQVLADAPQASSYYQLSASAEYDNDGLNVLTARLIDTADGSIAYSKTFSRDNRDGSDDDNVRDQDAIAREIAADLAQPYGIIQTHERAKEGSDEAQYRCLLDAFDYWRSFAPQQHLRARGCLEHATETNPGFALGYAALAPLILEEYRNGVNVTAGQPPALQRALQAARRAVELKPGSARAHQALADVQFARGDYPLAIEAGERALKLNPYDPAILAGYGGMLVSLGEQDRGARMVRQAADTLMVRPVWHDFLLFLAAYLADNSAGATRHAAQITSNDYPLGLVAHALIAAQRGEAELARQWLDRLAAIRPAWRRDCRGELEKYFPAAAIIDRIERDIGQIRAIPGG